MAQRARFFDSVGSDRVYTSAAWAEVITGLIGTGVVSGGGNELSVVEDSPAAMTADVDTGQIFLLGYYLEVYSAKETLTISAADGSNPRIDRVVARRDLSGRTALLAVLTGTPAASPTAPALTQAAAGIWEESLAQILVPAGSSSVVDANITDERTFATTSAVDLILKGASGHVHDGTDGEGAKVTYADLASIPTEFAPEDHLHAGVSGDGGVIPYANIGSKPSTFAPSDHGHTAGGDGGTIPHSVLTTVTADQHHSQSHTHDGVDSSGQVTYASITSKPSTFAPDNHATDHSNGGSDAVDPQNIRAALVVQPDGTALAGPVIYVGTMIPSSPTPQEGDVWIDG